MSPTALRGNTIFSSEIGKCYNKCMKKIFRMIIFSALALIFTSFWNKGFILNLNSLFIATLVLAFVFYLIVPLSKIILLPLNIITLGLMSFLVYLAILHLSSDAFHLFTITSWTLPGASIFFVNIPKTYIPYLGNLVLSSVSISSIINLLEQLL